MPPIRIVVAGDDKEFNNFLQSFVKEYVQKNLSMNKSIDFRVFLLPNKLNTLAYYLAMNDDLYCNLVYQPFT